MFSCKACAKFIFRELDQQGKNENSWLLSSASSNGRSNIYPFGVVVWFFFFLYFNKFLRITYLKKNPSDFFVIANDSILNTYFSWVFFSHCESLYDRISKYILKYFIFLNISDKIWYFKNWIKNLKPALDWLETNFQVLSKFVWDWLLNHRWKSKKFWLSLTFPEGKKTEKENHYSCLERNCFQIVVSQLFQMALLFLHGIDGIFKRPEENRWGFSFLMSQKVDEGKEYLSRIVCFKYVCLLYHLIDGIRDMAPSCSLVF